MISDARFFGGAHAQTLTASIAPLHPRWARLYQFRTSGTHQVELCDPDDVASDVKPGGVVFTIVNDSNAGSNIVEVLDHEGAALISLDPDEACKVYLGSTGRTTGSDGTRFWAARPMSRLA